MGLIKEPLEVDFYFDGRQMTDEDQKRVSDFIANSKRPKKNALKKSDYFISEEEMNLLHERADEYLAGGTKTYTVEESHNMIREQRKK